MNLDRHQQTLYNFLTLVLVQTGLDKKYRDRREHARATWFPSNEQEMQR